MESWGGSTVRRWILSIVILLTVSMLVVGCVPFGGMPSFPVDNDTTTVSEEDNGYYDDTDTGDTSSGYEEDDGENENYYSGDEEEEVKVDNAIYVKDIKDMIVASDDVVRLFRASLDVLVDSEKVVSEILLQRDSDNSFSLNMAIYYPGDIGDELFEKLHKYILDMGYSEDDVVIHLSKNEKVIQVSPIKGLEKSVFIVHYNYLMQVLQVSFSSSTISTNAAWGLDVNKKGGECWSCVYRIIKTMGIDLADLSKGFPDLENYASSFSISNSGISSNRIEVKFALGGDSLTREMAERIIEKLKSVYGGSYVSAGYGGTNIISLSSARCGDIYFEANYMGKAGGGLFVELDF